MNFNISLIFIFCTSAFHSACSTLADIRTESLKASGNNPENIKIAQELLREVEDATGGKKNWLNLKTMQVDFFDEWPSFLTRLVASPWPEKNQPLRLHSLLGEDNGFLELLDGKSKGKVWGIQNWSTFERANTEANAVFKKRESIRFWLPTIKYFMELPFRISEAQYVTYGGKQQEDSRAFDLVYATWGSFEPNEEFDQYLIWIDSQTKLIERIEYTVRDFAGFVTGKMQYREYRKFDGISFAMALDSVEDFADDASIFHAYKVKKVQFNVNYSESAFFPNPTLRETKHVH